MLGAIIGDIAGSVYEFHPHKSKDFPLFSEKSAFTDDTVMTLAVAEALMNGGAEEDYIASMQRWGRRYPDGGYGGRFFGWLFQFGTQAKLLSPDEVKAEFTDYCRGVLSQYE